MRLRIIVALLGIALPICAQEAKTSPQTKTNPDHSAATMPSGTQASSDQQGPAAAKPAPEMKRLTQTFLGRWKVTGKILDEQWAPGGAEGAGFERTRRGPNGFSLISDSTMDFGKMGPFAGHGVLFWDANQKAYTGFWCDSWAPTCESVGKGTWEGPNLVFTGEMQMGPAKIPMRQTYSNITKQGHDYLLEAGDGKGGWKKEMSLKYERSGPAAPAAPSGLSLKQ